MILKWLCTNCLIYRDKLRHVAGDIKVKFNYRNVTTHKHYVPYSWHVLTRSLAIVDCDGTVSVPALYTGPNVPTTYSSRPWSYFRLSEQCCQTHLSPEIICLIIKQLIPHYFDDKLIFVNSIIWWNILLVCCPELVSCRTCRNYFRQFLFLVIFFIKFPFGRLCKFCTADSSCKFALWEHGCRCVWRWTWSCVCNEGIRTGGITAPLVGRRGSKIRKSVTVSNITLCLCVSFYFCLYICLFVCLSTWNNSALQLDLFSWIYTLCFPFFENFSLFFETWQTQQTLYINTCVHFRQYLSEFFLEWEIFLKKLYIKSLIYDII